MTTGAELKVALTNLGLSPAWFGERLGVSMRTVVRWFDLDDIGATVAAKLADIVEATLNEMLLIINDVDQTLDQVRDPKVLTLMTYRTDKDFVNDHGWPADWHRSLTGRVAEHLRAQGHEVTIDWVVP